LQNPRGAAVYVVVEGKAALRPVARGATFDGQVEITSGLAAGDTVVVAGNTMLRDGSQVRIAVAPSDSLTPAESAGRTVGVTPCRRQRTALRPTTPCRARTTTLPVQAVATKLPARRDIAGPASLAGRSAARSGR